MNQLTFTVPGIPQPQGSTRAFMPRGGRFPVITSDNKRLRPWRLDMKAAAREAADKAGVDCMTGALVLDAYFAFPRPTGHFGSGKNAGAVRASAPTDHIVKPDLDKLVRAVKDALKESGVIRDDSQVVSVLADKVYGHPPGVSVTLRHKEAR